MLEFLIFATAAVLILPTVYAYFRYKDVFHPLMFISPMALVFYVYMPSALVASSELFLYVTPAQAEFAQLVIILVLASFVAGCLKGSAAAFPLTPPIEMGNTRFLIKSALLMGATGLIAWAFMMSNSGGIRNVFSQSYGSAWSDVGYIRDAVFLLLVAILILLSPHMWKNRTAISCAAIAIFSAPWLLQAILGARRGPTFVLAIAVGMSWYLARGKRPALITLALSGMGLGFLMLFLVTNRSAIYIGSDVEFSTDIESIVSSASTSNEYIFSAGCINAAAQTGEYFWGKRYLAQILVRPIPRQLWPNKYEDFGVPELLQNAGVAGAGLSAVMGWKEEPGAAAGMAADLWVEFSWLAIPVAGLIGWAYGSVWRRAVVQEGVWTMQYTILIMLSVYLVTQSMEAVIFRVLILSVPIHFVWRSLKPTRHVQRQYNVRMNSLV